MMNARCVAISEELWSEFIKALEATGLKIEEKELPVPWGPIADYHRLRTIFNAVFEVQGLKKVEGESIVPAIESLIAKYAAMK